MGLVACRFHSIMCASTSCLDCLGQMQLLSKSRRPIARLLSSAIPIVIVTIPTAPLSSKRAHLLLAFPAIGQCCVCAEILPRGVVLHMHHRVQYAYSVLSDERLRGIYDSYGEQGLKMYESYMSFAESEEGGPTMIPLAPSVLLGVVCGGLGLVLVLVTALLVTTYTKLEGSRAPLSLMLIPLWVLDVFAVVGLYAFLFASTRKGQGWQAYRSAGVSMLVLLLFIAFQVLLTLRVDGTTATLKYAAVCSPLYATEAIHLMQATVRCQLKMYEAEKVSGQAHASYGVHVLLTLGYAAARIVLLALVVLRLDGVIHIAWGLVLLPVWAYAAGYISCGCLALSDVQPSSEREQMMLMARRASVLLAIFVTFIVVLVALILDGSLHSWLPIYILPFTITGCFSCCCCCILCCMRAVGGRSGPVDVPPGDGFDTPMSTVRDDDSPSPSPTHPSESAPLLPSSKSYRTAPGESV